jgi:hypothetical protein
MKKTGNRLLAFTVAISGISLLYTFYETVIRGAFEIVDGGPASSSLMCPDAAPSFLKYFDISVAPPILFYAYIPAIILALFFGIYVFIKDKHSLQSTLLLGIALSFTAWVSNLMFQWTIAYVNIDMFSWQITPLFEIFIPILSIYFVYVFLNKKDLPQVGKVIFSIFILTLGLTLPTAFTTLSFDYLNCEANYGDVYYQFIYVFELISIFIVGYISLRTYLKTKKEDSVLKKQSILLGVGSVLFLTVFFLSNVLGEVTQTYAINLFGPIGILVFIGFISFMIVRYGLFSIKIIGTQILVITLIFLNLGLLFIHDIQIITSIVIATILLTLITGYFLVKSVKNEIAQREKIEKIAKELDAANHRQTDLLFFVTHQVKGFFTNSRNANN